jgi:hypothetical protein
MRGLMGRDADLRRISDLAGGRLSVHYPIDAPTASAPEDGGRDPEQLSFYRDNGIACHEDFECFYLDET